MSRENDDGNFSDLSGDERTRLAPRGNGHKATATATAGTHNHNHNNNRHHEYEYDGPGSKPPRASALPGAAPSPSPSPGQYPPGPAGIISPTQPHPGSDEKKRKKKKFEPWRLQPLSVRPFVAVPTGDD
jgi:hypothetical protein